MSEGQQYSDAPVVRPIAYDLNELEAEIERLTEAVQELEQALGEVLCTEEMLAHRHTSTTTEPQQPEKAWAVVGESALSKRLRAFLTDVAQSKKRVLALMLRLEL